MTRFIPLNDISKVVNGAEASTRAAWDYLLHLGILPQYAVGGGTAALRDDVLALDLAAATLAHRYDEGAVDRSLLGGFLTGPSAAIPVGRNGWLTNPPLRSSPSWPAALRNLLIAAAADASQDPPVSSAPYVGGSQLNNVTAGIADLAREQAERAALGVQLRDHDFANSATYLGSKRALQPFLLEALAPSVGRDFAILDLMCGSGAASAAFSRYWRTFASDAQDFCICLAEVQGGGWREGDAETVISSVFPGALRNLQVLRSQLDTELAAEDALFHSTTAELDLPRYVEFFNGFPVYPHPGSAAWSPLAEVERRRTDPLTFPYCLFTAYFANIYVGLRQAVEIDSLRYGIDQLTDPDLRDRALGALVASISAIATTYGGHFAQPLLHSPARLTAPLLRRLLVRRPRSVFLEFEVRLRALNAEGLLCAQPIEPIRGPWRRCLEHVSDAYAGPLIVYVDAPYRREEYSRYYHVLETAVRYNYPSATGRSRAPEKGQGQRFASEFFTRNGATMTARLASLLDEVLSRGFTCAWSYSDTADADISSVLGRLQTPVGPVQSYSAPHVHRSQGRRRARPVTEYLLILHPGHA